MHNLDLTNELSTLLFIGHDVVREEAELPIITRQS